MWRHACHHAAELVLEGVARAGAGARCTAMGRSAMSLDLQVLQRGIAQVRRARSHSGTPFGKKRTCLAERESLLRAGPLHGLLG